MTVVDVDAGEAADGATGKLNDKVNAEAARRLFIELSRRGIGGRIVIDFLPPSNAAARNALLTRIEGARRGVYDCRLGKLSVDGLLDLTAPRDRLSLLELATEHDTTAPIPGRRFTLDWRAKEAIRQLELALTRESSSRFRFLLGAGVHEYISDKRFLWLSRVAEKFGARFETICDEKLGDRDFDIA